MDGWFQSHAIPTSPLVSEVLAWMGHGKKSVPDASGPLFRLAQAHGYTNFFSLD